MKIIFLIRALWRGCEVRVDTRESESMADWQRDPLSHPTLEMMGLDQLADLPFDPRAVCRQ